jgi:hypothetical protein
LIQNKLSRFHDKSEFKHDYLSGVSLHSHTNFSKESLHFIPQFTRKYPMLDRALQHQAQKSMVPVDLVKAYWTPPLSPKAALDVEKKQIEVLLGLASLVSITDHDTIEAPTSLRAMSDVEQVPFAMEWTVPFNGAIFHLGIHNLPSQRAENFVCHLNEYTRSPLNLRLTELLAMLNECSEVLTIFNHPLWDLRDLGQQRHRAVLNHFLQQNAEFLHGFELNATRSRNENNDVIKLADEWGQLLVSGGDRHGCEPSAAINLTRCESFSEFAHEIRFARRSHVLFMPQYELPLAIRTLQTLLDVVREYPDYAPDCRRWDDRVFHPHESGKGDCAVSGLWKAPPAFIETFFSLIRLFEKAPLQSALNRLFQSELP